MLCVNGLNRREVNKALEFVDASLVWSVNTNGYEKHLLDIARQDKKYVYFNSPTNCQNVLRQNKGYCKGSWPCPTPNCHRAEVLPSETDCVIPDVLSVSFASELSHGWCRHSDVLFHWHGFHSTECQAFATFLLLKQQSTSNASWLSLLRWTFPEVRFV